MSVHTTFCLSLHLLIDIGVVSTSATVNNIAMNKGVPVFLQYPAFNPFGYRPGHGIAGSNDSTAFHFLRNLCTIFYSSYSIF